MPNTYPTEVPMTTLDEMVESLYDLDRDELRVLAREALAIANRPAPMFEVVEAFIYDEELAEQPHEYVQDARSEADECGICGRTPEASRHDPAEFLS